MNIVNANTLSAKDDLAMLVGEIKTDHKPEAVDSWLSLNLGTDLFNAWIAFDEAEPIGIMTAELVQAQGPTVFIAFNYVKPGFNINKEMLEKVEDWARKMEATKLLFYTKRSPNTFIKKYGFELVQSVLKKEL